MEQIDPIVSDDFPPTLGANFPGSGINRAQRETTRGPGDELVFPVKLAGSPQRGLCLPVAQRLDRIELGGFVGGKKSKDDADEGADKKSDDNTEQ